MKGMGRWRIAGLGLVFVWFFVGGIAHFAVTETEMRIVPPYIPWPRAAVLITGLLELLGAAGLLWRPTRRAAGIGLFLLTVAVTPARFYMLQRPELFGVPYWALVARLPVQAALLALIGETGSETVICEVTTETAAAPRLRSRPPPATPGGRLGQMIFRDK